MAQPNEKLADTLRALNRLQGKYNGVIESGDITEAQRVILVDEGFLLPVLKGWDLCCDRKIRITHG